MNESNRYRALASVCRVFTHPTRIRLIRLLGQGELCVTDLVRRTGLRQSTVSQHLAVLRAAGVVRTRRVGPRVQYRVADPRIVKACDLMRAYVETRRRADR